MAIEIEGDPRQKIGWEAETLCPTSGERIKSVFCPFRERCELPTILVKASDPHEAGEFTDYAAATGQIPRCLFGKPFLTKNLGSTIPFQPVLLD